MDGLRESSPSADSAGQFVVLASFSPLANNSIWINVLSNVSGRWQRTGGRRDGPGADVAWTTQSGSAHLRHQSASTAWCAKRFALSRPLIRNLTSRESNRMTSSGTLDFTFDLRLADAGSTPRKESALQQSRALDRFL
ncbi:MAG TPA: hypothetical protein VF277_08740, partial [Steroidobacteraceae bacterium]